MKYFVGEHQGVFVQIILTKSPFRCLNDRFPYPFIYLKLCNLNPQLKGLSPVEGVIPRYRGYAQKVFRNVSTAFILFNVRAEAMGVAEMWFSGSHGGAASLQRNRLKFRKDNLQHSCTSNLLFSVAAGSKCAAYAASKHALQVLFNNILKTLSHLP